MHISYNHSVNCTLFAFFSQTNHRNSKRNCADRGKRFIFSDNFSMKLFSYSLYFEYYSHYKEVYLTLKRGCYFDGKYDSVYRSSSVIAIISEV